MPLPKSPVVEGYANFEREYGGPNVGQPQYMPLPALVSDDHHRVTSRWELTDEERKQIAEGADVYITLWTFGRPYTPTSVLIANKSQSKISLVEYAGISLDENGIPRKQMGRLDV